MIYLDACALLKFIKPEKETEALREWRRSLSNTELMTSALAELELTRALMRVGADHTRVPYFARRALSGVYLVDLTSSVLARAMAYRTPELGSLDSIHLASAEPFRDELSEFVTYDVELAAAATELGFPVGAPV